MARRSRAKNSWKRSRIATAGWRIFTAAREPVTEWRASQTSPIAPLPSCLWRTHGPRIRPLGRTFDVGLPLLGTAVLRDASALRDDGVAGRADGLGILSFCSDRGWGLR